MEGQYDVTLDPFDEVSYRNRAEELIRENKLTKTTHFNAKELLSIIFMFYKLQRENGKDANYITRFQFQNVFHVVFGMPDGFLTPRIFMVLVGGAASTIAVHTWVKAMNIFLRGTLDEKIDYCYGVYDPFRQGIKRDQMMNLLRKTIFKHEQEDIEENVKGLVDLIITKMDLDRDGKISYEDFAASVKKDPGMMECLGQCLPDRAHVHALLTTFTDRIKKF